MNHAKLITVRVVRETHKMVIWSRNMENWWMWVTGRRCECYFISSTCKYRFAGGKILEMYVWIPVDIILVMKLNVWLKQRGPQQYSWSAKYCSQNNYCHTKIFLTCMLNMLCSTKAKSRTWVQLNVYFPSTLKCIDKIKMYMYTPVQTFGNSKINVFVCLFVYSLIYWFIDWN